MKRVPAQRRDSPRFLALARGLLAEGRAVRFRAYGWSMHPAIDDGEAITIEPIAVQDIRVGDVLLHRSARGLTAHRVMAIDTTIRPRRLVLKGDAAPAPDDPILDRDVLGRVVCVERADAPRLKALARRARAALRGIGRP